MERMAKGILYWLIVIWLFSSISIFGYAAIFGVSSGNITNGSQYYNFTPTEIINTNDTLNGDIKYVKAVGNPGMKGTFHVSANGTIMGIGPNINLSTIWQLNFPPFSQMSFPFYQVHDGVAMKTAKGFSLVFIINSYNENTGELNISYKYNNQPGNNTVGTVPTSGCAMFPTQDACFASPMCKWMPSLSACMESSTGSENCQGGGKMGNPGCYMLDGQQAKCGVISGCQWSAEESLCDAAGEGGLDPAIGIQCANMTNQSLCNSAPFLSSCCRWSSGACTSTVNNSCHESMNPPANSCVDPVALKNQTICNLLATQYYMPCVWNTSGSEKCNFKMNQIFSGATGPGEFKDISTETSCEAVGGTWRSETTMISTAYGSELKTNNWCEMATGKGTESCDTSCWACEYQANGTDWPNISAAQSACENSAMGFCKFRQDTNAFNGKGWCDMPMQMTKFGGGDCNFKCANCDFMNNPEVACNNSNAPGGCKWTKIGDAQGYCEKRNAKNCLTDCTKCKDTTQCSTYGGGGNSACAWQSQYGYCYNNSQSNGEICFDGIDNDNDGSIDCKDSDCSTDEFCGGGYTFQNNCGQSIGHGCGPGHNKFSGEEGCSGTIYDTASAACTSKSGCAFISGDGPDGGHCGYPGDQCFMFNQNDNMTGCNATAGCEVAEFEPAMCMFNETKMSRCQANMVFPQGQPPDFVHSQENCSNHSADGCTWKTDTMGNGGFCDHKMFNCYQYTPQGQSTCEGGSNEGFCKWMNDMGGPKGAGEGMCDGICFSLDNNTCGSNPNCALKTRQCMPKAFGGNCFKYDGNQTACLAQNASCSWQPEPSFQNDSTHPDKGFCMGKGMVEMFAGEEPGQALEIAKDSTDAGVPEYVDIKALGIKDTPNVYKLEVKVQSIDKSAVCQNVPWKASEAKNKSAFFIYLDTDGSSLGSCSAYNNAGGAGYEFLAVYIATYDSTKVDKLVEQKVMYRCYNSTWVPSPIPVSQMASSMCNAVGGAGLGIDKEGLKKYPVLFNQSATMRIYAATFAESGNESSPLDTLLGYYKSGAADFKLECCDSPGADCNGNGLTSEQDPDCRKYNQLGYVPVEKGPECKDGRDNDGNSLTDCLDPSCYNDPTVGCSAVTDKEAPTIVWSMAKTSTTKALVNYYTNEPANGSLAFYKKDSSCYENNLSATINDLAIGDALGSVNDFGLPHTGILSSDTLGYSLNASSAYYYKTMVCDSSGNCAKSGCLNFTTSSSSTNITLKMALPDGWLVNSTSLGLSEENFSYAKMYDTSTNNTFNVNFTLYFVADEGVYSIDFIGMSFTESKVFNLSNISSSLQSKVFGMSSDLWQKLLQKTGAHYLQLTMPFAGNKIEHCDDNGENCVDITATLGSLCTFGASTTTCVIPTSYGFSEYKISTAAAVSAPSPSGGGGGGARSLMVYTVVLDKGGVTQKMLRGSKVQFSYKGVQHGITLNRVKSTENSAVFTVESTPQAYEISVGSSVKHDMDGDGVNDLEITLNSISGLSYATITARLITLAQPKPIVPAVPAAAPVPASALAENSGEEAAKASQVTGSAVQQTGEKPKDSPDAASAVASHGKETEPAPGPMMEWLVLVIAGLILLVVVSVTITAVVKRRGGM